MTVIGASSASKLQDYFHSNANYDANENVHTERRQWEFACERVLHKCEFCFEIDGCVRCVITAR